jgi:radical SAM modification target selenobiotic family peptide
MVRVPIDFFYRGPRAPNPYGKGGVTMDVQDLKKFLAGIGIAGLLAGTSFMAGGCASTG